MELNSVVLPLFIIWLIALILMLFRRGIGVTWKIASIFTFIFYILFLNQTLLESYDYYRNHFNQAIVQSAIHFFKGSGTVLLLLWPVALFYAFRTAADKNAKNVLTWFVLLSVFYWLFFLLFTYLPPFSASDVEAILPDRLSIPDIPDPPIN